MGSEDNLADEFELHLDRVGERRERERQLKADAEPFRRAIDMIDRVASYTGRHLAGRLEGYLRSRPRHALDGGHEDGGRQFFNWWACHWSEAKSAILLVDGLLERVREYTPSEAILEGVRALFVRELAKAGGIEVNTLVADLMRLNRASGYKGSRMNRYFTGLRSYLLKGGAPGLSRTEKAARSVGGWVEQVRARFPDEPDRAKEVLDTIRRLKKLKGELIPRSELESAIGLSPSTIDTYWGSNGANPEVRPKNGRLVSYRRDYVEQFLIEAYNPRLARRKSRP